MAQKSKEVLSLQKRAGLLTENYGTEDSFMKEESLEESFNMSPEQIEGMASMLTLILGIPAILLNKAISKYKELKKSNPTISTPEAIKMAKQAALEGGEDKRIS